MTPAIMVRHDQVQYQEKEMYRYEGYIQPKYCKCSIQEKLTFSCHGN